MFYVCQMSHMEGLTCSDNAYRLSQLYQTNT